MDKTREHQCDMSEVWFERPEKRRLGLDVGGYLACLGRGRAPDRGPGPRGRTCLVVPNNPQCRRGSPLRGALGWLVEDPRPPVAMHEVQQRVAMRRPVGKAEDLPAGLYQFSCIRASYTPRGAERAFSGRGDCDRPMRLTARMFIQKALPCKEAHHDLASHSIDRGAAASR